MFELIASVLGSWLRLLLIVALVWAALAGLVLFYHYIGHKERQVPTEQLMTRTVDRQLGIVCYVTPQAIACVRMGVEL